MRLKIFLDRLTLLKHKKSGYSQLSVLLDYLSVLILIINNRIDMLHMYKIKKIKF